MPLTEKQREFIARANHRWNVKVGAVRSGKTYGDYFLIPHRIRDPARTSSGGIVLLVGATSDGGAQHTRPHAQNLGRGVAGRPSSDGGSVTMFGEKCVIVGASNSGQLAKIQGASVTATATRSRPGRPIYFQCSSRGLTALLGVRRYLQPRRPTSLVQKFLDSAAIYTIKPIPLTTIPCCRPSLCARSKRSMQAQCGMTAISSVAGSRQKAQFTVGLPTAPGTTPCPPAMIRPLFRA